MAAVDVRPTRWPTDTEFQAVIAATHRQGDRMILLALRLHDLEPDNPRGAFPGTRRIAALTGLVSGYVRNRLAALITAGVVHAERHQGGVSRYFIVPPVTPERDKSLVIYGGDNATAEFRRWLQTNDPHWTDAAVDWWATTGDTSSIRDFARRADSLARSAAGIGDRQLWRYLNLMSRPYLALARRDTAAALAGFAAGLPLRGLLCGASPASPTALLAGRGSGGCRAA